MDNFDLKKYLAEGRLLKEGMSLEFYDGDVELIADSGDYVAEIEDNGKVSFSVVYEDEDDREGMEFDEDNWKDLLGSNHAFVEIASKIPTEVEALDDYVMITVDLEDLKGIASLAEGRLLKEELTWYIEDENEDIRFQNDEYLREVEKKIKEIHPDISDENLNKIIIMAGEQYSREEDFHGDSIPSGNFVKAAVEIYQTDVLGSDGEDDEDFDRWAPENLDGDFPKDSTFAGWTQAQYDAYQEEPRKYRKYLGGGSFNLAEGKLLKEELKAPSGWTEIKDLSDMHRSEEDDEIAVKAWDAPMEGWDEENKDIIVVRKEDDKFYLDGYIPFGSFDKQGPFDTYEEALKLAVEEMEAFKEDWDE